jgi:hypothetical protein
VADGTTEGSTGDGDSVTGVDGSVAGVPDGASADPLGTGVAIAGDEGEDRATSAGGLAGTMAPAVSATVARMRFRSPMATTRRAR